MRNGLVGKSLSLVIAVSFIVTSSASGINSEIFGFNTIKNLATTLYVGGSGLGNYTNIQIAINNAND